MNRLLIKMIYLQQELRSVVFLIKYRIQGFHVTSNPTVDVMHDFFEGICRYDLAQILYQFTYVRQYFSLEFLNTMLRCFHYGPNVNKPPEILETHIKKSKFIILSSSEMMNLIRNLNLMIGFQVDEDDKHCQLLLNLKDIAEILVSTKISSSTPKILECKVVEYLKLLVTLFPKSLKPKHHFLIHYPAIMKQIVPLWNVSCMRFKEKDRENKRASHASICRINVCRTIALCHQLILNYRFLSKKSSHPMFISGRSKTVSLQNLPDILNYNHLILNDINENNQIDVTNWVEYNGKTIKNGSIVVTFSEIGKEFYNVHTIILKNEKEFLLIVKSMADCYLNKHLGSYKVYESDFFHWEILRIEVFKNVEISYANKMRDGNFYICKNWF